jgi:hypothetical protein
MYFRQFFDNCGRRATFGLLFPTVHTSMYECNLLMLAKNGIGCIFGDFLKTLVTLVGIKNWIGGAAYFLLEALLERSSRP